MLSGGNGTVSWAAGSLLSRHARGRTTPAMRTAVQMATAAVVLLGWLFAGETFTPRMLTASAVIIAGVGLVTAARAVPWPLPRPGARG
jgi:drug/metabolite transporter (DMT)-like permease